MSIYNIIPAAVLPAYILTMAVSRAPAADIAKIVVWDGEAAAAGQGWIAPPTPKNSFKPQTDEAHSAKTALALHGEGVGFIGGGWNWYGWYPADAGTDTRAYRNLSFWIKIVGPKPPDRLYMTLIESASKKASGNGDVFAYNADARDGKWHEVVIPLADMEKDHPDFDPRKVWEMDVNTWSPDDRNFTIYLDDIGFDDRTTRSLSEWVSIPEDQTPVALGADAQVVTAQVDTKAAGKPISPYIYGAAMTDKKAAAEMGMTILRAGGNPVTPLNWKHGFSGNGADWFFSNMGTETPPEKNWLVTFHGENKKAGLETYLTMPMMGRVAKDGTSVAFDIHKYPDQEDWAGKHEPQDPHANGGNGRQYVRDTAGNIKKDEHGNPVLRDIEPDPNDTSVEMSPEEQTSMLQFMIHDMKYGTAADGGVKFVALDNEPALWSSTHRGMHPAPVSYDELWKRTETYGSLLKKIDPGVKLAGPTAWGWTEYFFSGLDSYLVNHGKGTWAAPPDYTAHGGVPLTKWYLQKLADYKKRTGHSLVDILDFHFYPQNGIALGAGKAGDPAQMEARVQETRALWDPTWKDPSWMGAETGHVLQIIPRMKSWIAESNPGMMTSIGEYNFGGDSDVSGGVTQAELLGVFAREGLDFAFYWFAPDPNSPQYFGYKMFRNPDGQHTAFGDHYLPTQCSAPDDVSIHAAKDSKTGRLTFILVNKRIAKADSITLKLSAPVPAQDVTCYEYSGADRRAIGKLAARRVEGDTIKVDLAPMSVVRFDLKP